MPVDKTARPITNVEQAVAFLTHTLHWSGTPKDNLDDVALRLTQAEAQLNGITGGGTLDREDNRLPSYKNEVGRVRLRHQIFEELTSQKRLANDDDVKLGVGGAMPTNEVQNSKKAFFLIGLPASGKSGIANKISDQFGAIILDSDIAKRKLPEYNATFGADVVHEESSSIIFGGFDGHEEEDCVLAYAVSNGMNLVIPKIGAKPKSILSLAKELKKTKYENHLILVRLDRAKAARRAVNRYIATGRYVSIPLIYDGYGNDPTITYYDIMTSLNSDSFDSFTMISTDVELGKPPMVVQATESSPITGLAL